MFMLAVVNSNVLDVTRILPRGFSLKEGNIFFNDAHDTFYLDLV